MKKPNLGFYIQKINDIVTNSEKVGEEMNPSYEIVRHAIDTNTLADLTSEQLKEIQDLFASGTKNYAEMLSQLNGLKAPVKVMGIHKKLEKSFENYVSGCQEMVDSIDVDAATVNADMFNKSEEKQDQSTDDISFSIQRMTQIVMNK